MQNPPNGFYITIMQSYIRVIQIDPIAHQFCHFTPKLFIAENGFPTFLTEFFNSVFLYTALIFQTEHFFHFNFHRQTMSIPTGFAFNLKAVHCFITADNIFQGPGHYMMNTRFAICRRGSFIKNEAWHTFTNINTFLHHIVFIPIFANAVFQMPGTFFQVYCFIHIPYPIFF